MIRKTLIIAALSLVAACSKAPEDVTAHYSVGGGRGTITIKAAADGNLKVEAGQQTLIRKGGVDYVVINDGSEKFAASFADFVGATADIAKQNGVEPKALPEDPDYEAIEVGEEKVGEKKGEIWRVQPKGNPNGDSIQIVINTDPAYANVAKAVAMQTQLTGQRMATVYTSVPKAEQVLEDTLKKGMPLRMGEAMTLTDVTTGAIPASEFALPKVLDRAALRQRIMDQANKALDAAKAAGAKGTAGATPAPTATASPAAK
ncbi:hypothetical protein ACX40Y_04840 [Sphingomonas sp. RS6]